MKKSSNRGFTLIEVVIALFIFLTVCASTAPAFMNQAKFNAASETKTVAINLAEKILNHIRKEDITSYPKSGSETKEYNIGSRKLLSTISFCKKNEYCKTASRHITIDIAHNNEIVYSVETVYTQLK